MLSLLLIGPEDSLTRDWKEKLSHLGKVYLRQHIDRYPGSTELGRMVEEYTPDAVVVNLADHEQVRRVLGRLAVEQPQLPVIGLHTRCEERLLLDLMQIGVRELWFPPLSIEQMQASSSRLLQAKQASTAEARPTGSLVALLPARGGSGTSTIGLHTAAALQKLQGPVLFADFDFHNSLVAFWLKLDPRHGFQEALERAHWLDTSLWKGLVHPAGELDILTAPQAAVPLVFSGAESSAVLDFARRAYRLVVVDLPEAIYTSCWEVLETAGQILVVATPEMSNLYLARRKISQLVNHGIPRDHLGLVLNRCSHPDLPPAEVEKFLNLPVLAAFGNHYGTVVKAFREGRLVSPATKLGAEYDRFAASLAGVQPASPGSRPQVSRFRQIFAPNLA